MATAKKTAAKTTPKKKTATKATPKKQPTLPTVTVMPLKKGGPKPNRPANQPGPKMQRVEQVAEVPKQSAAQSQSKPTEATSGTKKLVPFYVSAPEEDAPQGAQVLHGEIVGDDEGGEAFYSADEFFEFHFDGFFQVLNVLLYARKKITLDTFTYIKSNPTSRPASDALYEIVSETDELRWLLSKDDNAQRYFALAVFGVAVSKGALDEYKRKAVKDEDEDGGGQTDEPKTTGEFKPL